MYYTKLMEVNRVVVNFCMTDDIGVQGEKAKKDRELEANKAHQTKELYNKSVINKFYNELCIDLLFTNSI